MKAKKLIQIKSGNQELFPAKLLNSHFEWFRGYMFTFRPKHALIFPVNDKTRIHMFFVFFRMRAIWLDKNKKIIQIDDCFPFSIKTWASKKARFLIEIPDSWKFNLKVGDKLSI